MRYRKKPVIIEATQWTGSNFEEIKQFVTKDLIYDIYMNELILDVYGDVEPYKIKNCFRKHNNSKFIFYWKEYIWLQI